MTALETYLAIQIAGIEAKKVKRKELGLNYTGYKLLKEEAIEELKAAKVVEQQGYVAFIEDNIPTENKKIFHVPKQSRITITPKKGR